MIKPGVKVCDVYQAGEIPLEDAGLSLLEMAGHGIGPDIHEPPSFDATNVMLLQEGMVMSLKVWI